MYSKGICPESCNFEANLNRRLEWSWNDALQGVDKKRSILPCYSHSYTYILNSDGMAVTMLTNNMHNFCYERHVHLCSVLHGMNSIYKLVVDNNMMGIVTVTVEDDACKSRTAGMCLNWKLTWQHSLDKEPCVKHMIKHREALLPKKLQPRLRSTNIH